MNDPTIRNGVPLPPADPHFNRNSGFACTLHTNYAMLAYGNAREAAGRAAGAAHYALIADDLKRATDEITRMRAELTNINRTDAERWFWQGDGEDNFESLTCPIVIKPDQLRDLIATGAAEERERILASMVPALEALQQSAFERQDFETCAAIEGVLVPYHMAEVLEQFISREGK
jgi:hypothetical protein